MARGQEVPGDLPGHLSPSTRPGGCCSRGWHGVTVSPHGAAGRCPVRSGMGAGRAAEPGSVPSGLPLPTAGPARSPRHRCTATVHLLSALTRNLHWGKKPKKPDPKCIPQPREAEQAQGGKSGAQESGAPRPILLLQDPGSVLQHININKNEIFNFLKKKKREVPLTKCFFENPPQRGGRWKVFDGGYM